jgi:glycosyltransferase involved in cell wall biosynthesis
MRVLLLNQCFYPDHVATAQYLTELALGLVKQGHEVTAVASSRGYDDPDQRYPTQERWQGVDVHRIWTPGLGKKARWRRFVDFAAFWLSATWILLKLPRFDVTVCLTSPPLISSLGTMAAVLKGGQVVPWVMDLNPDEAVAAGWLKAGGLPEQIMSALQRWSFRKAARIVVLDRFMAARVKAKGVAEEVLHTDAPWSHDDALSYDEERRRAFRQEHHLQDKFVVMYSGNHSPCNPLDTLLQAAERLARDPRFHFMFVGGGSEQKKVRRFAEERELQNIQILPYQPMQRLSGSLSSADVHVIVLGEPFVGMIHPCKIYNVLSLGLRHLSIGPAECHLTDLAAQVQDKRYCLLGKHGQVEELVQTLQQAIAVGPLEPSTELRQLAARFSYHLLLPRLIHVVEQAGGCAA